MELLGQARLGLLLSHLLHLQGIDTVILERQSRQYVEARVRAGVLEQGTVDLLREANVYDRMDKEGLPHEGFTIAFAGRSERINLHKLTGGSSVLVYGQTEVTRDLIQARLDVGGIIEYETPAIAVEGYFDGKPRIIYEKNGE